MLGTEDSYVWLKFHNQILTTSKMANNESVVPTGYQSLDIIWLEEGQKRGSGDLSTAEIHMHIHTTLTHFSSSFDVFV